MDQRNASGVSGHDLYIAKIFINKDHRDTTNFYYTLIKPGPIPQGTEFSSNKDDIDNNYIIIQFLYPEASQEFLPVMFLNIMQNFIVFDKQLKKEIESLLEITK